MTARRTAAVTVSMTAGAAVAGFAGYLGLVTGALAVDLGIGRRTRPLGPIQVDITAPREAVYDAIVAPYAQRAPRAFQDKVKVLVRGSDLVLAAHYTPISARLRATTVETVRFDPPQRVDFRLARGPVPQVEESFVLTESEHGTTLTYTGVLGTDLWGLGQRWGNLVAARWEAVVKESLTAVRAEAERRG